VFKVLGDGLLLPILHTCSNLWCNSCSKCYGMDCLGTCYGCINSLIFQSVPKTPAPRTAALPCFCWAWSPLLRYDWPRPLLFFCPGTWSFCARTSELFHFSLSCLSFIIFVLFGWCWAPLSQRCFIGKHSEQPSHILPVQQHTVQPLSPLQDLLDQSGEGGGGTAFCLVSMLSVAWLLSHFCYRNHFYIFMAELDHFHFF